MSDKEPPRGSGPSRGREADPDRGERKLRLVRPDADPAPPHAGGDEPSPSEEEIREASALREAIERGDEPVSSSLRAAYAPRAIEPEDQDALVEGALAGADGGWKQAGEQERAAAALLRDALARPESSGDDDVVRLARAVAAAARPREIDPLKNEALIARALGRRGRKRDVAALIVGAFALAAGAVLVLRTPERGAPKPPVATTSTRPVDAAVAAHRARSTMDLFDPAEPFPRSGGESSRMDRIARSRTADLRDNRFNAWRVPGGRP